MLGERRKEGQQLRGVVVLHRRGDAFHPGGLGFEGLQRRRLGGTRARGEQPLRLQTGLQHTGRPRIQPAPGQQLDQQGCRRRIGMGQQKVAAGQLQVLGAHRQPAGRGDLVGAQHLRGPGHRLAQGLGAAARQHLAELGQQAPEALGLQQRQDAGELGRGYFQNGIRAGGEQRLQDLQVSAGLGRLHDAGQQQGQQFGVLLGPDLFRDAHVEQVRTLAQLAHEGRRILANQAVELGQEMGLGPALGVAQQRLGQLAASRLVGTLCPAQRDQLRVVVHRLQIVELRMTLEKGVPRRPALAGRLAVVTPTVGVDDIPVKRAPLLSQGEQVRVVQRRDERPPDVVGVVGRLQAGRRADLMQPLDQREHLLPRHALVPEPVVQLAEQAEHFPGRPVAASGQPVPRHRLHFPGQLTAAPGIALEQHTARHSQAGEFQPQVGVAPPGRLLVVQAIQGVKGADEIGYLVGAAVTQAFDEDAGEGGEVEGVAHLRQEFGQRGMGAIAFAHVRS
ncbi:hypothetical protein D3C84_387840 [compost metagenome]